MFNSCTRMYGGLAMMQSNPARPRSLTACESSKRPKPRLRLVQSNRLLRKAVSLSSPNSVALVFSA